MFSIVISEKGGQQSKLDFNKTEITIGRMKGNDIVLPKSNVSKQHTRIFLRDAGFFIVDLRSTNGTYVNGRKIAEEQPITESDKIFIGDFILQVERAQAGVQPGPPQPPQPPPPQQHQGGPRQGGRHFPTVMDGQGGFGAPMSTPPPASPERRSSAAGMQPSSQPPSPPTPPPHLNSQPPLPGAQPPAFQGAGAPEEDLRQTMGDASPYDFGIPFRDGNEAVPTSLAEPTPTPVPVSNPTPTPAPHYQIEESPAFDAEIESVAAFDVEEELPREHAPISVMAGQKELENHFDSPFHDAQRDVARVFFETISPQEIPLDYPLPEGEVKNRIDEAVRAAVSTAPPGIDHQSLIDALIKEATGLGALEDYLDDPAVQAIYINGFDRIVLRTQGTLQLAPRAYGHPEFLELAARRLLGPQELPPVSDEVRFSDGTRVHILMPPLSVDGPTLTVRKPNTYFPSLIELVEGGTLSAEMAEFLEKAVQAGRSILIAGPTSAGKSTLLAALGQHIPDSSRVIAVEQHSCLPLTSPSSIRLEANPSSGFDLQFLLRNAVSMHPERILLDECRGAEAYEWVTAAASGTEGSMITLHGTSASDALGRLESMCLLGAADISPRGLREQIARSVDLVVVLHGTPSGSPRIHQIAEVQGVDLDAFRINDVFYFRVEGTSGAFHPTGYIPLFYEDLRHAGLDADLDIFRD